VYHWSYDHILFYLDVGTIDHTGGDSWVQIGHGLGTIATQSTSTEETYYEYNAEDGVGYKAHFIPSPAPGANDFFTIFADGGHMGLYPTYSAYWGSTRILTGIPLNLTYFLSAPVEGAILNSETQWPDVNKAIGGPYYVYFGENNNEMYDSNFSLFKTGSAAPPSQWLEWHDTPEQCDESGSGPYTYQLDSPNGFYSAFHVGGGS
jgi:hypothetical protein